VEKLTKDELRFFKFFMGSMPGDDRKDLVLVDYVRHAGNKFDEEKVIKKLKYNAKDKNSYYRLKNRVIQDIGDALTVLHTHKNDLYELQHYITLYHIYYSKTLYKPCLFYLKKAERLARNIENYELLDMVYSNFIRLSAELIEVNPDDYIALREENAKLVTQLRSLDDLLATVTYRLKLSQNFGAGDKKQLAQLQQQVGLISKQTTSHFGRNLQTKIYKALSQIFLQQHNYEALEKMMKETYKMFEDQKWFDKQNHDLKLQMLTYYANALYKNGRNKESLTITETLGSEIEQYGKLHYDRYLFFFYNLQIINNSVLNPARALKILDDFQNEIHRKKNYYYDTFIYLNRAGLFYDTGRYKDALKSLVKLYVSDSYLNADKAFRFKVEMSELIITYESADYDTLLYRIEQVKKDYKAFASNKNYLRDFSLLELLKLMADSRDVKHDADIQKGIKSLLKYKTDPTAGDSEIISYEGWLNKKLAFTNSLRA
ncbi:MAG TPA: hypothetical protein VK174_08725, partial [Chitinophagales bacterium]|nr:hypothetical protein [Chitinophagales bacterium]